MHSFRALLTCLVLASAFTVILVSGCREKGRALGPAKDAVELTYWPAPNAQEVELADSLVSEWNALHPDVHVVMQPIPVNQSTEEVLLAAIAGKTTPDICSNINPIALRDYVASGGLLALDQFSDFDSVAAQRVPPDLLRLFKTPDGHFYQVPWKTNPVMMFYNLRLLKSAGVHTVPRTYSDYYALGDSVLKNLNAAGKADIWMGERDIRPIWWQRMFDVYPFYLAASGGMPLFRNDSAAFGNTSAEEVFSFFRTCYARGYFPRTSFYQSVDPFMLEKKVTHIAGPWQVAAIRKFAPALDYAVSPIPVPDRRDGPVYTFGDFKNVAIFTTSKHPREAWAFVRFLLQAKFDRLLLRLCDQIPVRGDLLTNPLFAEYFRSNPMMVRFAEQIPFTRGMDSAPDMKEIFDGISQEYEMCAVYGTKAPAEAVRDAVKRARMIMEWNR
jgi:multiple sugar transport system substrate-binding protein